jgi:signal transduction histidine kinase
VILNLLTNVERYAYPDGRGGKVLVRVAEETDRREPCFVVTVQDFGRGIPSEDLPRVFDAFFTTGRGKGGSGLGLAIVHNIVTSALKGSVAAESELDKGTRVTVRFPRTIVD